MGQSTADRVMATGRPGAPEAEMQKWKIHQANMQSPSSGWVRGSGWVPKVDLYHFRDPSHIEQLPEKDVKRGRFEDLDVTRKSFLFDGNRGRDPTIRSEHPITH